MEMVAVFCRVSLQGQRSTRAFALSSGYAMEVQDAHKDDFGLVGC